jgi:mono/diheme cytochrome c family protein
MLRTVIVLALALLASYPLVAAKELPPAVQRRIDFEQEVRPIFIQACVSCHGPDKQRGGLRLDTRAALRGGDSGPVLIAKKSADSLLIHLVAGLEAERVMPPKGPRLTAQQIGILRAWIDQGATWPGVDDDGRDWWSLRALHRPELPKLPAEDAAWARNPVDVFIRAKLREQSLTPSPEADRRTLARRLYFDLIGLPPTPEDLEAFAQDTRPDAYERLVDRLLASPAYGERWARHWLDLVHYGDTHGYDKDKPRPNAWPYRDYVIRALNDDRSYSRFVQEQVAGDVLFPGTADGITALGFIAAGPWDFIGHAEVPESKIDGKVARHLDRDDMVANTMNTFVALTAQCAQCHNHKFDPIRQEDYYRLQAVFAALDRADRPYHTDPMIATRIVELTTQRDRLRTQLSGLQEKVNRMAGAELAVLDRRIAEASKPIAARPEYGYHSALSPRQDVVKWVQVDLNQPRALAEIVLWPCHDTFNNIGAGFGFPVRYRLEVSNDPTFRTGVLVVQDHTASDVPNPGTTPQRCSTGKITGRYVRVTATRLAPRQNDYMLALAEVEVLDAAGTNLARGATVTAFDSIEAPVRWRRTNLVDGYAPGQKLADNLEELRTAREKLLARRVDAPTRQRLSETTAGLERVQTELSKLPPAGRVYAGTIHTGSGSFRGTGPEGTPRPIHVLRRGDVRTPGLEVGPGAPQLFKELSGTFELPSGHREGDRRAALARWLTEDRNPLTWRVAVNRVWQHHFGRGIVASASDFGRMGQLPTHPELLDWLAVEFRDNGQSLKSLHRLLVTSATYRQVSTSNPTGEASDTNNLYLWRMSRRKLEAEAVRDAALAVAGKLDLTQGGPAFQDFIVERPEHSPHYRYDKWDPTDPRAYRRTVYRFLVRSKPQPFMTVLDCADPSLQVDKRTETLSPLQALALYNNGFMLTMARHLAERVEKAGPLPEQITQAFRLCTGRSPSASEQTALVGYAQKHGLPNTCRILLNLNEFLFVD